MERIDYLAKADGRLTVSGAPAGYDAWLAGEAAQRRRGLVLFIASDEAQAEAFAAAITFFAPDIRQLHENGVLIAQRIQSMFKRQKQGLPIVDPLVNPDFKQQDEIAKALGLKWDGPNLVDLKTGK